MRRCRVGGRIGGRRHGALKLLLCLMIAVATTAAVNAKTTMTMATIPESDAGYDVVSSVKANSAVSDEDDDSSSFEHADGSRGSTRAALSKSLRKHSDGSSSSSSKEPLVFKANDNLEVRSLNFEDALTDVWDLLMERTLRPDSSADGDKTGSSKQKPKPSPSPTPRPTPSTIKAESLSLSADDAVAEAIQSATPTPAPVVTTVMPTPVPATVAPVSTVSVTPAPVVVPTSTPKVTASPVRTRPPSPAPTATPPPVQTTEPITLPESPNKQDGLSSTSSASKGSLATDELVNNTNVKSGLNPTGFDDSIIVIILGGVGAIAVVVMVMSKKISKETGDDEALRGRSSFGVMRI